jgi:hypothetical protein
MNEYLSNYRSGNMQSLSDFLKTYALGYEGQPSLPLITHKVIGKALRSGLSLLIQMPATFLELIAGRKSRENYA